EKPEQLRIFVVNGRGVVATKRATSTTASALERTGSVTSVEGLIKGFIVSPIIGSVVGIQVVHSSSSSASASSEPESSSPSLSSCSSTTSLRNELRPSSPSV